METSEKNTGAVGQRRNIFILQQDDEVLVGRFQIERLTHFGMDQEGCKESSHHNSQTKSEIEDHRKSLEHTQSDSDNNQIDFNKSDSQQTIAGLYKRIRKHLDTPLSEEQQHELTRVLAVIKRYHDLKEQKEHKEQNGNTIHKEHYAIRSSINDLYLATDAILNKSPNMVFAQGILCNVEIEIMLHQRNVPAFIIRHTKASPIATINFGLFASFMVSIPIGVFLTLSSMIINSFFIQDKAYTKEIGTLLFVGFIALLGSMASVTMRLSNLSKPRNIDLMLLFWTAFSKPFIGAFFGCIIYAVLNTKFVNGTILNESAFGDGFAVWAVIGFLSGFSERFATDLIARTEVAFSGTKCEEK
jgi:hypothetical protein